LPVFSWRLEKKLKAEQRAGSRAFGVGRPGRARGSETELKIRAAAGWVTSRAYSEKRQCEVARNHDRLGRRTKTLLACRKEKETGKMKRRVECVGKYTEELLQ